jgi:hypothetical protein
MDDMEECKVVVMTRIAMTAWTRGAELALKLRRKTEVGAGR